MANFCTHCGASVEAGSAFCQACGAQLNSAPRPAQPAVPPVQQPLQPMQQPAQPVYSPVYQQPPVKKSRTGLIVTLSIVIPLVVALVLVALFVFPGFLRNTPNIPPVEPPSGILPFSSRPDDSSQPDEPDVEKYGIIVDIKEDVPFSYTTATNENPGLTTTGKVVLSDYTRMPVNEDILVFGADNSMDLRGYDILKVNVSGLFMDDASQAYGVAVSGGGTDYYDMQLAADTLDSFVDTYDETCHFYQVKIGGEEKTVYYWTDYEFSHVGSAVSYNATLTFLVPGGYDGAMIYFRNYSKGDAPDFIRYHDSEDLHLFRLD